MSWRINRSISDFPFFLPKLTQCLSLASRPLAAQNRATGVHLNRVFCLRHRVKRGSLLQWGRRHSLKCGAQKFSMGVEIPVEDGAAGAGISVVCVDQWIVDGELESAIGAGLRVGPGGAVAIPRPDIDVRKLSALQILKLVALFHRLLVEEFQVFDVDDGRLSVDEEQAVVSVGAERIGDPGAGNGAHRLEAGHDAEVSTVLLVEAAGESDGGGGSSGFRHLADEAVADF